MDSEIDNKKESSDESVQDAAPEAPQPASESLLAQPPAEPAIKPESTVEGIAPPEGAEQTGPAEEIASQKAVVGEDAQEPESTEASEVEATPEVTAPVEAVVEPVAEQSGASEAVAEVEASVAASDAGETTQASVGEPAESGEAAAASKAGEPEADSEEPTEEEEEEEATDEHGLPALDPKRAAYPWYVVHTYSGYEMVAKRSLEERIRSRNLVERFGHVLVPQETVEELVRGTKKTSKKKVFPGYILVQVDLDDETWHIVRDTPKITGFVGDSRKPVPLSQGEVEALFKQMEGGAERPRVRTQFEQGDAIKVVDGPFAEFNGTVDEVKPDKGKLRVLISIFGRNTPVELDFVQVEKV